MQVSAAATVRELTGARTRLVWVQRTKGFTHYTGPNSGAMLFGYDTDDGQEERMLLGKLSGYANPLLSHDGERVFFNDRRENKICVVNFDGSDLRDLGQGYMSEIWLDPETGHEWLYLRKDLSDLESEVYRRRVDALEVEELVWNRTATGMKNVLWFQLSANGRRFSGAFPWPHCGYGVTGHRNWNYVGSGCWPGMSPDNSYRFFIFDGSHTHANMFEDGGVGGRKVRLSSVPGQEGKKVYHPRWSNDVRFLTVTSPELDEKCELYLGRFDSEWNSIESWVRVTHNQTADLYGDAWIEPGEKPAPGSVWEREPDEPEELIELAEHWPGSKDGLVWIWENESVRNEAPPLPGEDRPFPGFGEMRGQARLGPWHEMRLDGGYFEAGKRAGERISQVCQKAGAITVELAITPDAHQTVDPATILALGPEADPNFQLVQKDGGLHLHLWTSEAVLYEMRLADLTPEQPSHLIVSCRYGEIRCFLNGKAVLTSKKSLGDFGNWEPGPLVLGAEPDGSGSWSGAMEDIAIFDRLIEKEEVAHHFELFEELGTLSRDPIPRFEIKAKLLEATPRPEVADLDTYRRALVENVYEVTQGIEELPAGHQIVVLQWVIMDQTALSPLPAEGEISLVVEPLELHPELDSEYRSSEHQFFDAPVYFDVNSHKR